MLRIIINVYYSGRQEAGVLVPLDQEAQPDVKLNPVIYTEVFITVTADSCNVVFISIPFGVIINNECIAGSLKTQM
jgi:hypothetical protein